ncbi:hypothetical protein CEE89_14695, partial [Lactobacillus crispatus]
DDVAAGLDDGDITGIVAGVGEGQVRVVEDCIRRRAGADDIATRDDLERLGGCVPGRGRRQESQIGLRLHPLDLSDSQVDDVDTGVNQRRLIVAGVQIGQRRIGAEGNRNAIGQAVWRRRAGIGGIRRIEHGMERRRERA